MDRIKSKVYSIADAYRVLFKYMLVNGILSLEKEGRADDFPEWGALVNVSLFLPF